MVIKYNSGVWVGLGQYVLEIHFNIGNDNRVILYYSVIGWVGWGEVKSR